MKDKVFFLPILFLALSLSFVYASDSQFIFAEPQSSSSSEDARVIAVADTEKQEPVEDMAVNLVSPKSEKIFELSNEGESIDIEFAFTVNPMHPEASCVLNVWGANEQVLKTSVTDSGRGIAVAEFKEGEYKWNVECVKQGALFQSEEVNYFRVKVEDEPNNPNTNTNTNSNGNGGSNNNNDEESNGRRLQPISLPLEELSTENQSSDDESSSPGITGAIIGALGNKGALGIIVLVIVVAVAAFVIYNRRNLGVVKESK